VGFGIAAVLNTYLTDRFGKGKVITLGAAIQVTGYAIILAPPPFPVIPCAFILVGLGVSLQLAQTKLVMFHQAGLDTV
jgi:MFS family permease